MCIDSVQTQLKWLEELIKTYKEIYDDTTISTIENVSDFRKYCMKAKHYYDSNEELAFLAKKKGLPMLKFNDAEIG